MTGEEQALAAALARIGVTITVDPRSGQTWGWVMKSEKISRPWVGPYSSRFEAATAALEWLVEHAWKGILCPHLHVYETDADPMQPRLRAFEPKSVAVE